MPMACFATASTITSADRLAEHVDSHSDTSVSGRHKRRSRSGMVWVDTYVRSDGAIVHGHWRRNAH